MVQYISKSAVVAEIENLLDKGKYHEEYDCAYRDGNNDALYALKDKLDTLEVKEVNLSKELADVIDGLSKCYPEISFAKLSRIAVRVAKWQKEQDIV